MTDESTTQPTKNDGNYPILKEYPLQSNLLQLIPARAQKGLSTFDIDFTCIDADGHYIVIGSNVGVVYLFDRIKNHLCRLRNEHKDPITCVKVLISLECLVAIGSKNGAVFVYKVPFGTEEELEKFTVEGLHCSSITALEWSKNGMKFFSGDESGMVVCTEIDHFEHQSRSQVLMREPSKIIQLSYSRMQLVVSTLFRSVIYSCEDASTTKIGQKERKCFGPFGAIISHSKDSTNEIVFASRPGQRLWKSDKSGIIHETLIFKSALSETHPTMELLSGTSESNFCDFQFGQLFSFSDEYILISSDSALLLIDPDHKSVVASCPKLDPIVSVCTANEEIFVLRGLRHLIRISSSPDPYHCEKVSEEPSLIEEVLVPFKGLGTFVKERSDSLSLQTENSTIFNWLRKSRSSSSPAFMPSDDYKENQNELSNPQVLPEVVKLESSECTPVIVDSSSTISINELPKIEITIPIIGNDNEDIVYKPKKKHKKRVRFRSVSPNKSERKPLGADSEKNGEVEMDSATHNLAEVPPGVDSNSNDSDIVTYSDETDSIAKSGSTSSNVTDSSNSSTDCSVDLNLNDNHVKSNSIEDSDLSNSNSVIDQFQDSHSGVNIAAEELNLNISGSDNTGNIIKEQNTNMDHNSNCDINCERINDPDDIYMSFSSESKPADSENTQVAHEVESQTSEESSNTSTETSDMEPPKYGVDWVEFKVPEVLLDLCVSNDHIFYVDIKNQLYYSNYPVLGLQLQLLDQPAEKVAVSPTESVVWALYKGTIYAAVQKSATRWKDTEWVSIARDVVSISVEDTCGWYVTTSGHLTWQPNLSSSRPCGYPQSIRHTSPIVQVSSWNGVLWVLNTVGKLFSLDYRKKPKYHFKEIVLNGAPEIDSIFLGVQQTGWIIDSSGIIRFMIGVTPNSPAGVGKPWEVEASQYFMRQTTQLQKAVLKALNNEMLTNLIRGKQHICLSTSPHGIWFCKTLDNLVYSNQKNIIGHAWDPVVPSGTTSTTKWRLISAAGALNSEGSVWCLDNTGELFCLDISSNTLLTVELPSTSDVRALIPTTQSLWLLTEDGNVFFRRGITPNSLGGVQWKLLDLAQLSSEKITFTSCSNEVAWGCTSEGHVFMRLGSLCPSSSRTLPQAWIPISTDTNIEETASPLFNKLSAIGKKFPLPLVQQINPQVFFCKVYVGPLGHPVWALDSRCNVYVREGVSSNFPIGKNWTFVPELQAKELCISKSAVWLLKHSGKIFRRFGISEKNPCGDYWKQIPGNMDYLSVTEDDDIWGLKDDAIFLHFSYVLNCEPRDNNKKPPARTISEDDDWEDIMVETSESEL